MAGRNIRLLGIYELTVYLVRKEIQIVLFHQIADLIHLATGIKISGRVIRIADKDGTGLFGNLLLELLDRRQTESVINRRLHRLHHSTATDCKRHIIGIRRIRNDNLIARIQAGHISEHYRLRTTCSNDYLIRREIDTVMGIIAYHLGTQRLISLRRTILKHPAVKITDSL